MLHVRTGFSHFSFFNFCPTASARVLPLFLTAGAFLISINYILRIRHCTQLRLSALSGPCFFVCVCARDDRPRDAHCLSFLLLLVCLAHPIIIPRVRAGWAYKDRTKAKDLKKSPWLAGWNAAPRKHETVNETTGCNYDFRTHHTRGLS